MEETNAPGLLSRADVGDQIAMLCQDLRCPSGWQRIVGASVLPNGRRDAAVKCAVCKRTRRMTLPPREA